MGDPGQFCELVKNVLTDELLPRSKVVPLTELGPEPSIRFLADRVPVYQRLALLRTASSSEARCDTG